MPDPIIIINSTTISPASLCTGTLPALTNSFCPSPDIAETDIKSPIELIIGTTKYAGSLTTNWDKRLTNLNSLISTATKILLGLWGGVDLAVIFNIILPNPFDRPNRNPPQVLKGVGIDAVIKMLKVINDKVDNLHNDLEYVVPVASVVEHWQLKKEALRPQCIFLWGEWTLGQPNINPPKYQTSVPYFDFAQATDFDNTFGFHKGELQGIITLADNSKVIIYARDEVEVDRIFTRLLLGIREDMKEGAYIKKGEYKGPPFSQKYVRLRRIDYYETGQMRGPQDDYLWFPRQVVTVL